MPSTTPTIPSSTTATSPLTLGLFAKSSLENERRLAIHPDHFERIDPELRSRIVVESGYGRDFGLTDAHLATLVGRVAARSEVVAASDIILMPKPKADDLRGLRDGQTVWGWPHCVQDREITQVAIDKNLTLIAFEAMNHWTRPGGFGLHVFHKNNELAGYSSVIHALQLVGSTGDYGRRLNAVVIGFGATARGAVTALNAHGVHDVDVLTHREIAAVGSPIHSVRIVQLDHNAEAPFNSEVLTDVGPVALAPYLAKHDIVVNCTLQDPDAPLVYLRDEDLAPFRRGSLIIDVSCDEGMGFTFARPTTFDNPTFMVGQGVTYYGVDHSPSYLWNSATWEISEAVLPFIDVVMSGPSGWQVNQTVNRAIEIREGVIVNDAINRFQGRASAEGAHL
ncbi:N(5)-(carboxyethyl)ornithine synthase [Lysinibacter cavernae]|uniref:Alanine dehydrogenase n=1 Tax=Lysinibacter cavernae TaxID=1640652 RepID=A0A7X5R1V3_9MICO|nr:N(5)-(carboxyethyl)ornithine synthase [Lysinibacter cavernae]NIH54149.1 alanine dehydrogenase [Lysinibacter cavernae]